MKCVPVNYSKLLFNLMLKQPPEILYKKGVLKHFVKFTGKHVCRSLFSKNAVQENNFIKTRDSCTGFSCDVYEILGIPFLQKTFVRLLLLMVGVN